MTNLQPIDEPETNRKLGWAAQLFEGIDWDAWNADDMELSAAWEKSLNEKLDV